MSYEELTADTERMLKTIMIKNDLVSVILIALCLTLIVLLARVLWESRKEKKQVSQEWTDYEPTVTEDVQVINGVEFHRMGIVGRR